MTQEEIDQIETEKEYYKSLLKSLSAEIKALKERLVNTTTQWKEVNKSFMALDRKVAEATKVRVITRTSSSPPPMSSKMAQEILGLLGVFIEKNEEEIENEDEGMIEESIEGNFSL